MKKIEIYIKDHEDHCIAAVAGIENSSISAVGDTPEKALLELSKALQFALEVMIEDGDKI